MLSVEEANSVPVPEYGEQGRVRGAIIQAHLDWLRDHGSRDEIIDMLESLRPSLRHQVLAAQPAHWYRFSVLVDLQQAIVARLGSGNRSFMEHIGVYATEKQLAPLRGYLRRWLLHDYFRGIAARHRDAIDFGASGYAEIGDDAGRMTVYGLHHAPSHLAFLAGCYREAIHQHGAFEGTVVTTADGTFDFSW